MNEKLKFGFGNSKLAMGIATFSIPAGHSCPFARECLTKSDRTTGKLSHGKHIRFRCFSATQENTYKNVREARWKNFDLLNKNKDIENLANLIQYSLPLNINMVRVHVSGDFYSESYFLAWVNVALNNPGIIFYGYTKAVPFIVKCKSIIPRNFRFVCSLGGTHDHLIKTNHLKSAEVVFSPEEAKTKKLELDHDDSHAINGKKSFAILIHGTQPPGTPASKAWTALRKRGIGGYGDSTISRNNQPRPAVKMYVTLKNGLLHFTNKKELTVYEKLNKLVSFQLIENGEFNPSPWEPQPYDKTI
jgi:hypothetical protein